MKVAVYDMESRKIVRDMTGKDRWLEMGISWGCVWVSWELMPHGFVHHYLGRETMKLKDKLEEADLVISFNGISFDDQLVEAHAGQMDIKNHYDIHREVLSSIGKRVGLEDIAYHTLGEKKIDKGDRIEELVKNQDWARIASYCSHDVLLTLYLFCFIRENGYVMCKHGRVPLKAPGGVSAWTDYEKTGADTDAKPPTTKQINYLKELDSSIDASKMTRRQVSDKIDELKKGKKK